MPFDLLSKTRYLNGLQCPRLIWIEIHKPEKIPETDSVTQYIFDQGYLVGELAKKLFPEGIDISTEDFMRNVSSTMDLLRERKPLFEAVILASAIFLGAGILMLVNGNWQSAIFLLLIGLALGIFFFRG